MNKNISQKISEPNIMVGAIADLLLTDQESDDFERKYLEKKELDYSIMSLQYIDKYLEKVKSNKKTISNDQYSKIILRCGAYTGEAIRKNSQKDFSWITFDEAIKNSVTVKDLGKSLLTNYILQDKKTSIMIFPMA